MLQFLRTLARVLLPMSTAVFFIFGIGLSRPAPAQDFQSEMDLLFNIVCQQGGPGCNSLGAAGGPGGQFEVQNIGLPPAIGQHLQNLRCDAYCDQIGGTAADRMAFESLNVFFSPDYQNKDKEEAVEAGFESNLVGFTAGIERSMERGVIGGALNLSRLTGDFDHNGGDFKQESIGGLLYGSYYPTHNSFIDGVIGLAHEGYDLDRTVVAIGQTFGSATGDTSGLEFQGSLSAGYDFRIDNFSIGPRVGIQYLRTELSDFAETGSPLALHYEDQVKDSLKSTLGFEASVALCTDFGMVVPQVNAAYVHEFLNDRRTIHVTATDGSPLDFVTDPPDRDYFKVGGGVVLVLPNGISPYLNYSAEFGNRYEEVQTVSAGVSFEL
ncbi:MAG TPA: autotransporter outer membrane beta-barrel domain-containing protein [Aestuariivirga sp.]|nr:autotransporter outer membrane beta-barrel domain-containing protein [Aestuariivirga sp.]